MLKAYWNEIRQFDAKALIIIIWSTFLLLLTIYIRRVTLFFPEHRFLDRLIVSGVIFMIGPLLLLPIFRYKFKDFGIQLGNVKQWIKEMSIFFAIMLVILVVAFKCTNLKEVYPLFREARVNVNYFLIYQGIQLFHMLTWEFFFRGFMLFGLEKKYGRLAILIQTIPFAIMHFRKPALEAYGSIFAGIFQGTLGLRSRSFLPCALLHFLVALAADLLGIVW
ncbi:CPBP family intramembrane metalloprotease [candidate division WOR-3 bacterium]|nr:CPBP family intramembrane metalloprotease [candidate division WOR-3 bacterium]